MLCSSAGGACRLQLQSRHHAAAVADMNELLSSQTESSTVLTVPVQIYILMFKNEPLWFNTLYFQISTVVKLLTTLHVLIIY